MPKANIQVKNILISGAGGDIGLSLGQILKDENFQGVFGTDISNDNPAECVFDKFFVVPRADEADYFATLEKIFREHKIQLFIPSSEAEIAAIIRLDLKENYLFNVPVIILDSDTTKIALDKLETAIFLQKNGIITPWTELASGKQPKAFPCILKPRSGQGSKGIKIINSFSQYNKEKERDELDGYIWQELLKPDTEEYTCGIFCTDTECRTIIFKRTLNRSGVTDKGEVVHSGEINNYLINIAELLNLRGVANFQLRLTCNGPRLFEINPRFSSTVRFRHLLGFCDLIWSIETILGLPLSPYTPPASGVKFYRGYCEYIK